MPKSHSPDVREHAIEISDKTIYICLCSALVNGDCEVISLTPQKEFKVLGNTKRDFCFFLFLFFALKNNHGIGFSFKWTC